MNHYFVILFSLIFSVSCFSTQQSFQLDRNFSLEPTFVSNGSFNFLRGIEIRGLLAIPEIDVRRKLTVFKGDQLTPFVIKKNINQIKELGFFQDVKSEVVNFDGGKKWIITLKENPVIESIQFNGNEILIIVSIVYG